jgi:hypothetical protein
VINLEYGVLEPWNWLDQNFYLETNLVLKTVISNLILNWIASMKDAKNRTQMLETKKDTIYQITPAK